MYVSMKACVGRLLLPDMYNCLRSGATYDPLKLSNVIEDVEDDFDNQCCGCFL